MSRLKLTANVTCTIDVPVKPESVFALLANVPDSVSHFPGLVEVVPLYRELLPPQQQLQLQQQQQTQDNTSYKWLLKKLGYGQLSLQLCYGCKYFSDASKLAVWWKSIPACGNAEVNGHWEILPTAEGTKFSLHNRLVFHMWLPQFLKFRAESLTTHHTTQLSNAYLKNLALTLTGGDGRVSKAVVHRTVQAESA
jgi:hypothetical protein